MELCRALPADSIGGAPGAIQNVLLVVQVPISHSRCLWWWPGVAYFVMISIICSGDGVSWAIRPVARTAVKPRQTSARRKVMASPPEVFDAPELLPPDGRDRYPTSSPGCSSTCAQLISSVIPSPPILKSLWHRRPAGERVRRARRRGDPAPEDVVHQFERGACCERILAGASGNRVEHARGHR